MNEETASSTPVIEYPSPAETPDPSGADRAAAEAAEADVVDANSEGEDGEGQTPVPKKEELKQQASSVIADARKREVEASRRIKDVEQREAAAAEREKKFSKEELKKNPAKLLEETGLTLQELAESVLAEGEQKEKTPGEIALEKVEQLEKQKKSDELAAAKQEEEKAQAYIDEAVVNHRAIVSKLVDDDADGRFELIKAYDQKDLVTDIVIENWKTNGTMMPMEEALNLAENFLLQRTEKAFGTKKVKEKFAPTPPKEESPSRSLARTLTNSMASGADVAISATGKRLSRDEKLKVLSKKLVVRPD